MKFYARRFHCARVLIALAVACATLVAAPAASASPSADGNLRQMLQYSTGIAIVKVVDYKPFDPLYPGINWEPVQSATCKVQEVLAGSPPETFQVAIYSPDVKKGDMALVFIGRRPNDKVLAKKGHEYLFFLSGGFHLLTELVKPGQDDANATALAAIKEAAKVIKPPVENVPDKGLMPFYRLLDSRNHDVRWWAFCILRGAPNSPFIERTLVSCLHMDDDSLSSGAAYAIVTRRLELTAELQRFLARRQWESLPYIIPRMFKEMVVGPPDHRFSVEVRVRNYLLALKIQKHLRSLSKADSDRLWDGIAPHLTEQQPGLTVGFRIDETSKLQVLSQAVGPDLETLELLEGRLALVLADEKRQPLSSFDVRFSATGDSPLIEVFARR